MTGNGLLLRDVRLGERAVDVLVVDGRVASIGSGLAADSPTVDGRGGLLLPGLHDHHLHLLATAAADSSVRCGPPAVRTREQLTAALAAAPGEGWIRGVGYDESVAGPLDRTTLDALTAGRPVRVQHRGGSLWTLNSAALDALGLAASHPDGRLWREDETLRTALGGAPPDLTALGVRMAGYGVTGVTDATPGDASALAAAAVKIPQRVITLGTDPTGSLAHGPYKIVVSDHALPALDDIAAAITAAHAAGRAAAIHSVTRESLLLTLAAFDVAGARDGDRVEHSAIAPPEAVAALRRLGITVVTQPSLVALRGDSYLDEVDPDDLPYLWPYRSLLAGGVRVGCSSDAPYGDADPWRSVRAASTREAPDGRVVVAAERVDPRTALDGYLTDPADPGGVPRRVEVGVPADLVLLAVDEREMIERPSSDHVRLTIIDGRIAYERQL